MLDFKVFTSLKSSVEHISKEGQADEKNLDLALGKFL